jgi:hypothetical protein
MKGEVSHRSRRAPRWVGAVATVGLLVLATACVTELTDELGEFTYVVGVNRGGDRVVTESGWLARYGADGTKFRLQAPEGFETSYVVGHQPINDAGVVVGVASSTDGPTIPVMWEPDGTVTDLRRYLPHSNCADLYAHPPSINGDGLVVGSIWCGNALEPTVKESYVFDRRDRSVRYLPAATGLVIDVNDAGVVVGLGSGGVGGRWTPDGAGYRFEQLDLSPTDINNVGDVVGHRFVGGTPQPFVLRAGASTATELAAPGRGVDISDQYINDNGMIVVTVYTTGIDTQSVRYSTPESAPEPFPGIGGDGSYFEALGEDGAAYAQARDEQNLFRAVRWTP